MGRHRRWLRSVGAAFADELSRAGFDLVLIARKPGPLQETADKARSNGVQVRTLALDLLDDDAVEEIRKATEDIEVGLFIFNAGANSYGHEFVTGDLDGFRGVIELNVHRQIELSHLFGGPMKERGRGGIMLLGSLSGYMGAEHQSIYAARRRSAASSPKVCGSSSHRTACTWSNWYSVSPAPRRWCARA